MKTTNLFLVLSMFLTLGALGTLTVNAQIDMVNGAPQAIRYQALAKDQQGNPVSNQLISIRISIISDTISGPLEWEETHFPTTDDNGLFTVLIGAGVRTGGAKATFSEVEWASKKHFLRVEMDITGGTNFGDMGTTQFCSVPFAFSASEARRAVMADTARVAIKVVKVDSAVYADTAKFALLAVCGCSLDDAYDQGGPGAGRIIIADSGAVRIEIPFLSVNRALHIIDNTSTNPFFFSEAVLFESNHAFGSTYSILRINNHGSGNGIYNTLLNPLGEGTCFFGDMRGLGIGFFGLTISDNNNQPTVFSWNLSLGSAAHFRSASLTSTLPTLFSENFRPLARAGVFCNFLPTNSADALLAQNVGLGRAGIFQIDRDPTLSPKNLSNALQAETNGKGNALRAINSGEAGGAGSFQVNNAANTSNALEVTNFGTGVSGMFNSINNTGLNDPTLFSINQGIGFGSLSGLFVNFNTNNNAFSTLYTTTFGLGKTAFFNNFNAANDSNVVEATAAGTGTIIRAYSSTLGPGRHAGHFSGFHPTQIGNPEIVVLAESDGIGTPFHSISSGSAGAAAFSIVNTANANTVLTASTDGAGVGVVSVTNDGDAVQALSTTGDAIYASTGGPGLAGHFIGNVECTGDMTVLGCKPALVKNAQGEEITTYVVESAEVWFQDWGFGTLVNGEATINIEAEFLSTINTNEPYHVKIQLEGFCKGGVYITDKTLTSFKVVQNTPGQGQGQGQLCNASFSYNITAKRKGFETLRLATQQENSVVSQQNLQNVFPGKIAANQQKVNSIKSEADNLIPPGYSIDKPAPPPSVQTIVPNPWINGSIDVVAPVDTVSITIPDLNGP